ncbi:MAG TPA: protoglobin domain-containing protein [Polyangiaceae bacterium]|nr:protoglobin domain-containing protein [Polyangiaceae bacterium]
MDRARLAEMQSFLGFTEADEAILMRLHPMAKGHFGAIADEFYALIRTHEGAFAVLQDEAQAQRLHASLQVWLGELLSGPRDDAYVERRIRIGRVHVRVGLDARYVIAAMGRIRTSLMRVSDDAFANDTEASGAARLAVVRACDLDLAIMLESYKDDFATRIQRARTRENEGDGSASPDGPRRGFSDPLDAANVAVLWFDGNARLFAANRKAEELTGYAADELADGDVFELLFGDRAAAVRAHWHGSSGDRPAELEEDLRTRAGKTRTLRWYATAHRPGDGGGCVVVGVDLTSDRELERRARQHERLAATENLAAGLAHEIRNPLNGASLHLSVLDRSLARSAGIPPAAREATDVLRAEIKRLSALVTDFLEVARPRPLARVVGDANEIARSVGALLGPEAEAQNKVLAIEPFPLPAAATLDVERVRQVVVNLVRNGLDAVGEGGRVVVRVRRLPHHIEIDVADDGRGVPDPAAPIFDAFYTSKERGTGLGLSIVHRIVTDHGGDVRFESRPGSTVFTVRIPADTRTDHAEG